MRAQAEKPPNHKSKVNVMKNRNESNQVITRPSKQKHWSTKSKDAIKSERRERSDDMKYAA